MIRELVALCSVGSYSLATCLMQNFHVFAFTRTCLVSLFICPVSNFNQFFSSIGSSFLFTYFTCILDFFFIYNNNGGISATIYIFTVAKEKMGLARN